MENRLTALLLFPLLLLFPAAPAARANDGAFRAAGNQLVPLEETEISIRKETLTLRVNADSTATVEVCYEFFNPSPEARELTVGFMAEAPQNFVPQQLTAAEHPYIQAFSVVMNGESLPFQSAVIADYPDTARTRSIASLDLSRYEEEESGSGNYLQLRGTYTGTPITYAYYFTARFRPGTNKVEHRYRYRLSESVFVQYALDYMLSPALRWANGQIDDFTLRIVADSVPVRCFINAGALSGARRPHITADTQRGGAGKWRERLLFRYSGEEQAHPCHELSLRHAAAEYRAENFRPAEELRLLSADFSESGMLPLTDACVVGLNPCADLSEYNAEERRAIKLYPAALRGERFKDKSVQRYYDARWWYMKRGR